MLDTLGNLKRTKYCGDLRASDADRDVVLMGWVHRRRDLGQLIFIDLRDRAGIAQIVFNKELNPEAHAKAEELRSEFVVAVEGRVIRRQKVESRDRDRRSGSDRHEAAHSEHVEDAAIPDRRRGDRERRDAPALPLSRSAPPAAARQYRAAAPHRSRNSQDARRTGILRD